MELNPYKHRIDPEEDETCEECGEEEETIEHVLRRFPAENCASEDYITKKSGCQIWCRNQRSVERYL